MTTLTLKQLRDACENATAFRRLARLQPAGGPGEKVFPPTYEGGDYALEDRVIDGARVPCVLLDSVQSQANRMEACLLEAHRDGKISIPVVTVDFASSAQHEVGNITSLDAPHRLADAILRDSLLGGKSFRDTDVGRVLDTASVTNATGLFEVCPTALVFGLWDSAGPRGGLGTKFARTLVGEVVAINIAKGARPSSRLDPLGIQLGAGPAYKAAGGGWTLDEAKALKEKGKALKVGKDGKPSELNHGNVTPSLKSDKGVAHHGGVTFGYARQSAVLSLVALRRLRFPSSSAGGAPAPERDLAGRTVLAALGLAAIALNTAMGNDLRSRCLLVQEVGVPAHVEILGSDGVATSVDLSVTAACALLKEAVDAAAKIGLSWHAAGHTLTPKPELVELVRRSRTIALSTSSDES